MDFSGKLIFLSFFFLSTKEPLSLESQTELGLLTVTRQQSSYICSPSWVGSLTEDTSCFLACAEISPVCLFVYLYSLI